MSDKEREQDKLLLVEFVDFFYKYPEITFWQAWKEFEIRKKNGEIHSNGRE